MFGGWSLPLYKYDFCLGTFNEIKLRVESDRFSAGTKRMDRSENQTQGLAFVMNLVLTTEYTTKHQKVAGILGFFLRKIL